MAENLTKRVVENTEPREKDFFLYDGRVTGFGLKVTPTGRRVYIVQYRFNGRKRRFTIGPHGSPWTVDQARKEAERILGLVVAGKDPSEQKQTDKKALTVAQLCELYLVEGVTTKKESTLATDQGRIQRHIIPLLGKKKAYLVTKADVQRFISAIANGKTATDERTGPRGRAIVKGGEGASTRTVGLLGGIFSFAVERGLCKENPCYGVKKYKEKKRERYLKGDELTRLGIALAEADENGVNPYAVAAIRLLLFTGMRRGEVLDLQWTFVDFERSCLFLPDSKTGQKVVHLGAPALQLLGDLPRIQGNPYVFPGQIEGQALVGLPRIWRKIRDTAGLQDVRIHDLRHSFASVGAASGMGLPIIGKLLGHTQASTTNRYAHLADDPLKAAADQISNSIANLLKKQ
uniref:Putative Phage integrase family protein n=1 Tax=Magnetococcus massalia (strain MO-1) TaxID=451514 RepID=A0A1S7LQD0_MAGMO|nr:Putative Phage integrase family protein [Candidatus Magnetococcus massalia]